MWVMRAVEDTREVLIVVLKPGNDWRYGWGPCQ